MLKTVILITTILGLPYILSGIAIQVIEKRIMYKCAQAGSFVPEQSNNIFTIIKNTPMTQIYRVYFRKKINGRNDYYFFSLAAIYDHFTPEQIGCELRRLWEHGIRNGNTFKNDLCTITREEVYRKPQANPQKQ